MFMNLGFRQIFTIIATLLFAINVPAQELPLLPADPAVLTGVTPNGMSYYLVSNPDYKGVADFALVQKTGLRNSSEDGRKAVEAANTAASVLKRSKLPINPGNIETADDATIFRFENVRLTALDSTLILLMDIADRANYVDDEFIMKWYSPADQAVIISGDIDSKAVASKLTYMSYMIPPSKSQPRREYVHDESRTSADVAEKGGFAEISATWKSRRLPREYMNTVQPEIFDMSLNILGTAAVSRIRKCLETEGVPFADVSYGRICSSTYPYDDSFSIHVAVGRDNASKAVGAVAAVMASIKENGLMEKEYVLAESSYIQRLADAAAAPVKANGDYVERCVNAFLYNASLASPKERLAFHRSRDLPDTMRLRLFNDIAAALIDTVCAPVPETGCTYYTEPEVADTLTRMPAPVKIKIKSSKKEPVSGGTIWTFSNGFKVIFKRMPSDRVYYSLALNGGCGSIEDLSEGEGAFIADYLGTCRFAGMDADDFMTHLKYGGISMDAEVNLSNMMLSGHFPKERTGLMLRSLLAVANERTHDGDVERFITNEYIALDYAGGSSYSRMTAIDSIMCPGYSYSPFKAKGRITDGFQAKAEKYFDVQFAKANDGALIIAGDIDEDSLKRQLLSYVGHFRTAKTVSRKPIVKYQPVSGSSTYTVEGDSYNVDLAVSVRMPLTLDNFVAAKLAAMVIDRGLSERLDVHGIPHRLSHNCRIYPEERMNALVSIPFGSPQNLAVARAAISEAMSIELTDNDLTPYKESLKHLMALEMKSPAYWIHAVALRYLDGKDLTTNYASRIDAVSPAKVKEIMGLLQEGTKVEYVTIKK